MYSVRSIYEPGDEEIVDSVRDAIKGNVARDGYQHWVRHECVGQPPRVRPRLTSARQVRSYARADDVVLHDLGDL